MSPPATMSPRLPVDTSQRPYEVAIVGNDTLLAARPARPMQVAHALLACGFDLVVPVSWGDEALAEHTLRVVAERGAAPAIICSCPAVRARLLAAGAELTPYLISLVAPSVATARYLRALQPQTAVRLTYIGSCEGASHEEIEMQILPDDFFHLLVARGISLARQPVVFDSVVPPDRRRFVSQPGGCPSAQALATRSPNCRLVSISDDELSTEIAEFLLSGENVLIDLSSRFACVCCGGLGVGGNLALAGRDEILRLEPPPAATSVLDLNVELLLDAPIGELPTHAGGSEWGGRRHADQSRTSGPLFPARLPGAHPIESARLRAERRRIAVTPSRVVTFPGSALVTLRGAVTREGATREGATREAGTREAGMREAATFESATPESVTREGYQGLHTAGQRSQSAPINAGRAARWTDPLTIEPRSMTLGERSGVTLDVAQHAAPGPYTLAPAAVKVSPRAKVRTPVHRMFHLGRRGTHPHARASDGVVLPRAFIGRRPLSPGIAASRTAATSSTIIEVERPLSIAVEPVANGLADKPANGLARASGLTHASLAEAAAMALDEYPTYVKPGPVAPIIDPVAEVETVALHVATSIVDESEVLAERWPAAEELHGAADDLFGTAADVDAEVEPAQPKLAIVADDSILVDECRDDVAADTEAPISVAFMPADLRSHVDDVAPHGSEREMSSDVASDDFTAVESLTAVAPPQGAVPISPEIGARVREQFRREARAASRHVAPPPKPREFGSLIVLAASAVVVVALIIAFALILRLAPTAPW